MKKRSFTIVVILLNFISVLGQDIKNEIATDSLFKPNYPEGIYKTKDDFIKKVPSQTIDITPKGLVGFTKPVLKEIAHNCFFYDTKLNEKITDAFAISYKGHLYFRIAAILKNRNKTDRSQSNNFPNSFVRVTLGGDNYLYTEAELANAWAKGLAYSGGAIGGALAGTMDHGKGIVWDFKNNEFNIFKNCKDYNDLLLIKIKMVFRNAKKTSLTF